MGQFAHLLRERVEYSGPIISFEPNPDALKVLRATAANDPLWHINPVALASSNRTMNFNAYEKSDFASFRDLKQLDDAPQGMVATVIELKTETLEKHLELARREFGFKRPFLKMDTQGFDLDVAKGAGTRLVEFVGIQTEVAFNAIYENVPSYTSTIEFFEKAGFDLSALFTVHEAFFPKLVEMDMLLVRQDNH